MSIDPESRKSILHKIQRQKFLESGYEWSRKWIESGDAEDNCRMLAEDGCDTNGTIDDHLTMPPKPVSGLTAADLEVLESILSPPAIEKSENYDRDEWMYAQRQSGKTLRQIKLRLKRVNGWNPLNSEAAITRAIDTHAKRYGLPQIEGKRGRPKKPRRAI